jgi:ferredoxin-NADP reductase
MIRHATEAGSAHRIFLFYSIRRIEEAAFLTELREIHELDLHFKLIPTITHPDGVPRHWEGELGHINEAMLTKWLPDYQVPIFYVAGPPGMVAGMRHMLGKVGVSDDDIRAEEFAGY